MKISKDTSSDYFIKFEKEVYLDFMLREKLIDYIMMYQTSQSYTFEQLCQKTINELYQIRKEVG